MKTYSKAEATDAIREMLRGKVEIGSIEHVKDNEFLLTIVLSEAGRIPIISAQNYQEFLDSLAGALSQKLGTDVSGWSTDNRFDYLGSKSGNYWTRRLGILFENLNLGGKTT